MQDTGTNAVQVCVAGAVEGFEEPEPMASTVEESIAD